MSSASLKEILKCIKCLKSFVITNDYECNIRFKSHQWNQKHTRIVQRTHHIGHLNGVFKSASVSRMWSDLLRCVVRLWREGLFALAELVIMCRARPVPGWRWPAKANVKSPLWFVSRCRPGSRKKYLSVEKTIVA